MRSVIMLVLALAAAPSTTRWAAEAPLTPQAFQRAYRDALNAQDADAVKKMFLQRTPGEAAMVEVLVANELDVARLAAAAGKAFGVRLLGGGTLVPPAESDQWSIENSLATIPGHRGGPSRFKPLRKTPEGYKIDLVAGRMTWLDDADAAEARARFRSDPAHLEPTLRALAEGRYRTIEEFRDVTVDPEALATAADSPPQAPPRPFRRPVKLDLTSPQAAMRSYFTAIAEGDGAGLLQTIHIVDPADEAGLKALARRVSSVATIAQAVTDRFGPLAARFSAPAPLPSERIAALQMLAQLDGFEHRRQQKLETDEQLVVRGDEAQWMEDDAALQGFVRVDGKWKIRSRMKEEQELIEKDDTDWTGIYNMVAQLEEDFAARIARGEFKTLEEATAAMDEAMRKPPYAPADR